MGKTSPTDVEIAPILDLLRVVVPQHTEHILAHERVFVTSIEFWTAFTGLHLLWPVRSAQSFEELWPIGVAANSESVLCGQWHSSRIRTHHDMFITTDSPLPSTVEELTLIFPVGALDVRLNSHES